MNAYILHESILENAHFTFARSAGPGGQNVNKVNTKVYIHMPIANIRGLSLTEITLIRKNLKNSINAHDEVYAFAQQERTQALNKKTAVELLEKKLIAAARILPKRKITKPPRSAHEKRLQNKSRKSAIKRLRSGSIINI
ncbi:MAG: peptide chain release factor-like protein [Spirochaetales bacterium]